MVHGNKYGRAIPQLRWNASPGWSPEGHVSLRKNSRKEASRLFPDVFFFSWEEETNCRLFLHYRSTVKVWHMVLNSQHFSRGLGDARTYCWCFELLDDEGGGSKTQKGWCSIVPTCIWCAIWRKRNLRCHENITNTIQKVKKITLTCCIFGVKKMV